MSSVILFDFYYFMFLGNDDYISESLDNTNVMTRTVSITLSVAAGYMLLVIGLMLWCRYRQLKRKQAYLAESKFYFSNKILFMHSNYIQVRIEFYLITFLS